MSRKTHIFGGNTSEFPLQRSFALLYCSFNFKFVQQGSCNCLLVLLTCRFHNCPSSLPVKENIQNLLSHEQRKNPIILHVLPANLLICSFSHGAQQKASLKPPKTAEFIGWPTDAPNLWHEKLTCFAYFFLYPEVISIFKLAEFLHS